MKRDEIFPSKYLKAADLAGKPVVVTIASADLEHLKSGSGEEQAKTVLSFVGGKKTLPLNMTNWDSVADICGDDTADWIGKRIELYPTTTNQGRSEACIRVREPVQRQLSTPKPRPVASAKRGDMDDEIPSEARKHRSRSLGANPMIKAALALAGRGLHVFPCLPRRKEPATPHGCKDATVDPDVIRRWWGTQPAYNVAVATGIISKMFAVDIDGFDAECELRKLESECGELPPTVESITARGRHLCSSTPAASSPTRPARSRPASTPAVMAATSWHLRACIPAAAPMCGRSTARHDRRRSRLAGREDCSTGQ